MSSARAWSWVALASAISVASFACGTVIVDGTHSGGVGGSGGSSGTVNPSGGDGGSPCDPDSCSGPTTSSVSSASASSTSSSSSTGGGAICGGFSGTPCPEGQFCVFPDQSCGNNDNSGNCQPIPTTCFGPDGEVCGCDRKAYPSACAAQKAGVDTSTDTDCLSFKCGGLTCDPTTQYCHVDAQNGVPVDFNCFPLPHACHGQSSCDCVPHCGLCAQASTGGVTVTCDAD